MITASGAGAAFIAVPTKRLKPKTQQHVRLSPNSRPPLYPPRSQLQSPAPPTSISPPPPLLTSDPAHTIESLLIIRNRVLPSASARPTSLGGIGESERSADDTDTDDDDDDDDALEFRLNSSSPSTSFSAEGVSFYRGGSSGSTSTASTMRTGLPNPGGAADDESRRLKPKPHPSPPLSAIGIPVDRKAGSTSKVKLLNSGYDGLSLLTPTVSAASTVPPVRDIFVAVIGSSGVGKSTFIQKAFDLPSLPLRGDMPKIRLSVDRMPCSVKLVELDAGRIDFEQNPPQWPRVAEGQRLPFVDGVLLLYDVTNDASIVKVPESLGAFTKANLPVCLVSTKCDVPRRQLNPNSIEHIVAANGSEQIQTSVLARDSQKQCIAAILSMISRKNEKNPRYPNGRRRANSSAANSRATSPRPSTGGHSRASSEFSTSAYMNGSDSSSTHASGRFTSRSKTMPQPITLAGGGGLSPAPYLEVVSTSPFSMQQINMGQNTPVQETYQDSRRNSRISETSSARQSYADTADEDSLFQDLDDIPILEREGQVDELLEDDRQVPARGWTWDELVDRLLSQPMSRADQTFAVSFLCFYRKFASPRELLMAVLDRFEMIETQEELALHRIAMQIRYCNVLHRWVTSHPGDFSHLGTRQKIVSFLKRISINRSIALLTKEVLQTLQEEVEDEDDVWGRTDSDTDSEKRNSITSFMTGSSFPDQHSMTDGSFFLDYSTRSLAVPRSSQDPTNRSSALSFDSAYSTPSLLNSTSPTTTITNSNSHYDLFMSLTVDEIASELTRIDWTQFSRIKPRDLIRHISIPSQNKEKSPNLAHINKMISHFNHLAYWVATIILEKPKSKHRAKALEKFMEVAWALRHRNNYNSLGAVIAGINGTAVHRLQRTRERVDPHIHKNFMRLELLMGTQKGHSKYRLAWENSTAERIPFMPLHRRDLVFADEGNRTFLNGEKINWEKFQIMGDVLQVVLRSQATPYRNLPGSGVVEKCIRDASAAMNDDELYERSVQLENANAVPQQGRRAWFSRLATTNSAG